MYDFFFVFLLIHLFFKKLLTLEFNIILIKNLQYMIFLYKFYNLLSLQCLHQQRFNHACFESISLYDVKNRSRLEIDLFVKWEAFRKMGAEWATTL